MAGWVEAVANTAASAVVALKSAGVPGYPAGTLNKVRSNPGVGVGARLRYVELKADHSPIWFLPSHGGLVWALSGLSEIIVWGYGYHSGDPRVVYVKTGSGSLLGSGRAPVIELGPGTNALPLDFEAMSETMLLNALGGKSSGRKAYVHQVAAKCLLGDLAGRKMSTLLSQLLIGVVEFGLSGGRLIQAATGSAGGTGWWRTNRSGCAV